MKKYLILILGLAALIEVKAGPVPVQYHAARQAHTPELLDFTGTQRSSYSDNNHYYFAPSFHYVPVYRGRLSYTGANINPETIKNFFPIQQLHYSLPLEKLILSGGLGYGYYKSKFSYNSSSNYCRDYSEGECLQNHEEHYYQNTNRAHYQYMFNFNSSWSRRNNWSILGSLQFLYDDETGYTYYETYDTYTSNSNIDNGSGDYTGHNRNAFNSRYLVSSGVLKNKLFGFETWSFYSGIDFKRHHFHNQPEIPANIEPYFQNVLPVESTTLNFNGNNTFYDYLQIEAALGDHGWKKAQIDRKFRAGWLSTLFLIKKAGLMYAPYYYRNSETTVTRWDNHNQGLQWDVYKDYNSYIAHAVISEYDLRFYMFKKFFLNLKGAFRYRYTENFFRSHYHNGDYTIDMGLQHIFARKYNFEMGFKTKAEYRGYGRTFSEAYSDIAATYLSGDSWYLQFSYFR